MAKIIYRYQVLVGMPGYMPNSNTGPYVGSTRREFSAMVRDMLDVYGFPAKLVRDANIRSTWQFIARNGSSQAHFTLYHGAECIEFIGLTEDECEAMERENENS